MVIPIKIGRHTSHTLQAARKAGIDLDYDPNETNVIEQEQADIT
jgi:hypothetical protein